MEAVSRFDSVSCAIALKDIYEKVTFGDDDIVANRPSPEA
jgi:hypothetical protein